MLIASVAGGSLREAFCHHLRKLNIQRSRELAPVLYVPRRMSADTCMSTQTGAVDGHKTQGAATVCQQHDAVPQSPKSQRLEKQNAFLPFLGVI